MSWIKPSLHFNSSSENEERRRSPVRIPLDLTRGMSGHEWRVEEKQMVAMIAEKNKITCWWAIRARRGHCPPQGTTLVEAAFCLNNTAVRVGRALCPYFTGKIISTWSGFYISLVSMGLTVRYSITQSWSTYWSHSELWHHTTVQCMCLCMCAYRYTCAWAVPPAVIPVHSVSKLNAIKHVGAAT